MKLKRLYVLLDIDRSRPIHEGPVEPAVAVGAGYGESKWVAERLLEVASKQTPTPTVSVRIGQLSGSEGNGAWNYTDWFPSLVKSSLYLKCMPSTDKVRIRRIHFCVARSQLISFV